MTDRPDPQLDFDGMVSRTHPQTAKDAAKRIKPKTGTQRMRVLTLLKVMHPLGLTDQEMQNALSIKANSQNPRRLELKDMDWIEDSGERRETDSGMKAIVWMYKE